MIINRGETTLTISTYKLGNYLIQKIRNKIFSIDPSAHGSSHPVLRKENGTYYLAVFVDHFKPKELFENHIYRPDKWAIFDIESGELIKYFDCRDKDFSDTPLDTLVPVDVAKDKMQDQPYYERLFEILDKIRLMILEDRQFDIDLYNIYLDRIAGCVNDEMAKYYMDLSLIDEKDTYRKAVAK